MDVLAAPPVARPSTADLIKRARYAHDPNHPNFISQTKLAEMIGVSPAAVALWETRRNTPKLANLTAAANALGVPVSQLISDEFSGQIVRDHDVLNVVSMFERLNPEQRNGILATLRVICDHAQAA